MYTDIGSKIKTISKVACVIGVIGALIIGITIVSYDDDLSFIALLAGLGAAFASLVTSFVLYGFGELVENSGRIGIERQQPVLHQHKAEMSDLLRLKEQGIISEEEYQKKVSEKSVNE